MPIFKVGTVNKCFEIDGKLYQAGDYDYNISNGSFTMFSKLRPTERKISAPVAACLDGDNANTPFTESTLKAWIKESFFFLAGGSGGGGSVAWADVTGKPSTFTPSAHTHAASDVISGVFNSARLANGTATDGYTIQMVSGVPTWVNAGGGGSGWNLSGNSGTGASNFIGTTDDQNVRIKANNTLLGQFNTNGGIAFNETSTATAAGTFAAVYGAAATAPYALALGVFSKAYNIGSVALGNQATANHDYAMVIANKGSSPSAYSSLRADGMLLGAYAGFDFQVTVGTNEMSILGSKKIYMNLNAYADNTAAIAGGLSAGMLYKLTNGEVRIVV